MQSGKKANLGIMRRFGKINYVVSKMAYKCCVWLIIAFMFSFLQYVKPSWFEYFHNFQFTVCFLHMTSVQLFLHIILRMKMSSCFVFPRMSPSCLPLGQNIQATVLCLQLGWHVQCACNDSRIGNFRLTNKRSLVQSQEETKSHFELC